MTTFGIRFKKLRLEKGMTQQDFAEKFYLNKSSISRYEKNKQIPEMDTLLKFTRFFDVSLDYLMGNSDIKKPEEIIYINAFHKLSDDGLTKEDIDIVKAMIEQLKKKNK